MKHKKQNYILGVTGLSHAFHDNSAVLLKNGKVIFAASEERYSRIKHDRSFPIRAIKHALNFANIKPKDISYLTVGYPKRYFFTPFLESPFDFFKTFLGWIRGRKLRFLSDCANIVKGEFLQNTNRALGGTDFADVKIVNVDHHLAHAASAYYTSGFNKCLAVSMDAFGPKNNGKLISGAVFSCNSGKIVPVEEISIDSSIGLFYTAITQALEFTPGDGEGKTMGLAAYGNSKLAYKKLKEISPYFQNGNWHKSPMWMEMFFANRKEFRPIFNVLPIGIFLADVISKYGKENVAAAAQLILEEECVEYFAFLQKKYKVHLFALSGGVFLNVKMNQRIIDISGIEDIFVHPNAGDGGTALGSALWVYGERYGFKSLPSRIDNIAWGSEYSHKEILKVLKHFGKHVAYRYYKNIAKVVAQKLVAGVVVGWYQGRFEWGPRALGFRSVLIDPRRMDIKDKLNNTLKNREWFMPFAPSVMDEYGKEYFVKYKSSPFMTLAFNVRRRKVLDIKAAIHVDKTARPNSVTSQNNAKYYALIKEFYKITKIPVVLNTSFNKHGLPIVNSPEDAVRHLLWNCIDQLAIGNFLVKKREL